MIPHVEEPSLQGQPSGLRAGVSGCSVYCAPPPLTASMSFKSNCYTCLCVWRSKGKGRETRPKSPFPSLPFGTPATQAISEFTQQDGRKKRTAKRFRVTNVTGVLLMFFVVIFTSVFFLSFTKRPASLKEG